MYLIRGKEKHSGEKITILLLCQENSFSYLRDLLFSEEPKIKKIDKLDIWNIKNKIKKFSTNMDAIFIKCDKFYSNYLQKSGYIIIPELITTRVDISEPLKNIYKNLKKSAKEDIRKVKKNEFIYEISHDVNKLKLFFYKMYLPYSYRKFGNLAVCANFYAIRHLFDRGSKLMLIKLNDKYVSGSLLFMRHNTLFGTHAGVIDNNIDYLKKGAATANYYFSMIWAKEIGAKFIDFGTCKPFLNDGILQYKKKWGVFIRKAESSFGIFAFKILNHSIGIDSFLLNNPFINLNNGRIEGVIVFKKDDLISFEKIQHFLKLYNISGLEGLSFTFPQNF